MEKFFSYELDESFRGVKNNINPDNIDSELISMGGSIRISRIINNFIAHPFDLIGKLKNANRLPYEDIHCPVLILRAGKKNLREGDEVLPLNALYDMMKRIKDCRAYTIPELNHFEIILSDHEERNAAILKFIDSVSSRKTTVW